MNTQIDSLRRQIASIKYTLAMKVEELRVLELADNQKHASENTEYYSGDEPDGAYGLSRNEWFKRGYGHSKSMGD